MHSDYSTVSIHLIGLAFVVALAIAGLVVLVFFGHNSVSYGQPRRWQPAPGMGSFEPRTNPVTATPSPVQNLRNRRQWPRRRGNPVAVLIADVPDTAEPVPGVVIDRSRGGLCLASPQPVAMGAFLQVRASASPDDLPWIRVEVRHCRQRADRWLMGCKFEHRLSTKEMLPFG